VIPVINARFVSVILAAITQINGFEIPYHLMSKLPPHY
jgi:hypothetical protein